MAEMTQANLYLHMWRATKDPKYIRLFREAIAEQASVARYSLLERLSRRAEKVEGKMDDHRNDALHYGIDFANGKDQTGYTIYGPSENGTFKFRRLNITPPTEKQRPPDGKVWTEEELLAELEELP
jgi:hypothetical protein